MTTPSLVNAALSGTPNIISGILTSSNGFTGYLNAAADGICRQDPG